MQYQKYYPKSSLINIAIMFKNISGTVKKKNITKIRNFIDIVINII